MAGAILLTRSHAGAVQLSGLLDAAGVNVTPNATAPLAQWALDAFERGSFEVRGRGPDRFDCMGLAIWAQQFVGRRVRSYLDLYAELNIRHTRAIDRLVRAEVDAWRPVEAGGVGDVLVLGNAGGRVHHVAVLCGAGRAIHAVEAHGIMIQKIEGRRAVRRFAEMRIFGCVAPA